METVTLSRDMWEEVREAVLLKMAKIKAGEFGPEINRGEDRRWLADLRTIADTIEEVL